MNISVAQKILWKFVDLGKLAALIRERDKHEIRETSHSDNQTTRTQDSLQYQIHAIQLDRKTYGACHDRNAVLGVFTLRTQHDPAGRQRILAHAAAIRHHKPNY
jgi:hypothetical protein